VTEGAYAAADQASAEDPSAPVQPCPLRKKEWIEIELLGEDGHGVADEIYRVTLPDASVRTGKLDARGLARLEGLPAGTCKVTFPRIDEDAWGP
jgi:hypothetical protein